jgi:hypothetical protein
MNVMAIARVVIARQNHGRVKVRIWQQNKITCITIGVILLRESMEIFAIQRNYPAADVAHVVNIE